MSLWSQLPCELQQYVLQLRLGYAVHEAWKCLSSKRQAISQIAEIAKYDFMITLVHPLVFEVDCMWLFKRFEWYNQRALALKLPTLTQYIDKEF